MERSIDGERRGRSAGRCRTSTRSRPRPTRPTRGCPACSSSARPGSASRCTGGRARTRRDEVHRGRGRARAPARPRPSCGPRMAVELRPPVAIDKGTAVDALIDGFAVGAFAGDDTGDLPAFAALRRAVDRRAARARGPHRRACRPRARPSSPDAVDVSSTDPTGLLALLRGRAGAAHAPDRSARVRDEVVEPVGGRARRRELAQAACRDRRARRAASRARRRARPRICSRSYGCTGCTAVVQLVVRAGLGREAQHAVAPVDAAGPSLATRLSPSLIGFTSSTS